MKRFNGTADYANTKKEVENLVNTKILPSLAQEHLSKDTCNRIDTIKFLYRINRMSALEAYLRLALIDLTGHDNFTKIDTYFKEDDKNGK